MNTFQANTTVEDAGSLVLRNLPFRKGERVHVVVESEHDVEERRVQEKKRAFELFQKITARMNNEARFQSMTEEEISE